MTFTEIVKFLQDKPGYLKYGKEKLATMLDVSVESIIKAKLKIAELDSEELDVEIIDIEIIADFDEYLAWKKTKEATKCTAAKRKLPKPFLTGNPKNVLTVGDIHEPFSLKGYLEFCREKQEEFNCGTVVFIGDIIDNHAPSFHDSETCAMGTDDELELAKQKVAEWYSVFPKAYVTIGNHDRIIHRKAKVGGISTKWIREYSEVLNTPGWKFVEEVEIDNVCYNHGEAGTARSRMKAQLQSQVQGHLHSQAYIEYSVGAKYKIFGAQVGCGVDREAYAMSYGRIFQKPVISCLVVLNKGTLPILLPMEL